MRPTQAATPLDNLKLLATRRVSSGAIAKCRLLAQVVYEELGVEFPRGQELDGRIIGSLQDIITEMVIDARPIALGAIESNPIDRTDEHVIAAVGELVGVPYDAGDGTFDDLRRRLRGVGDDNWRETERKNNQPKKRRQVRANVWLRQLDIYSYKAVEGEEAELLSAFLARFRVHIQKNSAAIRQNLKNDSATASTGSKQPADLSPEYVQRPTIERRFAEIVERGAKLIVFVGHPGMGKTTLAEALARKHSPEGDMPATIRFAHGDLTVSSLRRALSRHRLATTGLSPQNLEERLVSCDPVNVI